MIKLLREWRFLAAFLVPLFGIACSVAVIWVVIHFLAKWW